LWGGGAGSFRSRYLSDRDSEQAPREAHSIELELLGELGAPGLLLFVVFVAAAVIGALRSRKLGPEAAFLTTVAFTVGAVYLAQASVDWFWSFAGLTAPVVALLGSAVAPQAYALREAASKRRRRVGIAATLLAVLTLVPLFYSARLTTDAAENWRADSDAALSALDSAAALNPLADTPLLVKAEIARQLDDTELALDALEDARTRQPKEYFNYEIAAKLLASENPQAALEEAELGLELNPRSEILGQLADRLRGRLADEAAGSAG
jgi:tetratricopeptide (TPR) repeat protein